MSSIAQVARSGTACVQLAKARGPFPHIARKPGSEKAAHPGNIEKFVADFPEHEADLKAQMFNRVRKCACGKPNAYTLDRCNGCGNDISATPISFTPNVFMAFVYGIEQNGFRFSVSIRKETPEYLVLDDMLVCSVIHLNCIPTTTFIPDVRPLFAKPEEGLKIVNALFENCADVVRELAANVEFRKKFYKHGETLTVEDLIAQAIAGFNYPPSQYQLHLQFMIPPLTPFHYYNYLQGVHYTHKRFIPLLYVQQALAMNAPMNITADTTIDEIFDFFRAKGLDYDRIHGEEYKRYNRSHHHLSGWEAKDFEYAIVDNAHVIPLHGESKEPVPSVTELQNQDKLALQNYGRPYDASGKPTGSFYSFAKKVGSVKPRL